MGKPAARMGDLTAHGGTIVLGLPTVLIGKMPASTLGDMHVCPMCTGPVPHVGGPIILGSMGVLIGKKPAARVSDQAVCVGPPSMNAMGCFTVLIGEAGSGSQAGAAEAAAAAAAAGKTGPKTIKPFPLSEPPAAPPKVHAVDFVFLDSAGKPLGGIPFTLKDPDGKLIVGASSMDGKGSYGGYIKEGSFTVTIPVLSEAKWDKAEIAASESCGWSVKADGFDEGAQAWVSVYGTGEGGLRIMVATEEKKVQGGKVSGTWDAKASLLSESGHKPELETCETFQIMVCVGQCVAVSPLLKVYDTVEIVLTGDAGKPRKNMPYTLTLRDGTVLKGKLDGQGKAKHEKVVRGRFQVVFGDAKVGANGQEKVEEKKKTEPAVPVKESPTPRKGSGMGDLKEAEREQEAKNKQLVGEFIFPLKIKPEGDFTTGEKAFRARRSHGKRLHAGCDLYAPVGTEVRAVGDGIIVQGPSKFYAGTYAIYVDHGDFQVCYGEIQNKNPDGLKVGSKILKGQLIGYVGYLEHLSRSMLHFEMYKGSALGAFTQVNNPPFMRRKDLMDPTSFLIQWLRNPDKARQ